MCHNPNKVVYGEEQDALEVDLAQHYQTSNEQPQVAVGNNLR